MKINRTINRLTWSACRVSRKDSWAHSRRRVHKFCATKALVERSNSGRWWPKTWPRWPFENNSVENCPSLAFQCRTKRDVRVYRPAFVCDHKFVGRQWRTWNGTWRQGQSFHWPTIWALRTWCWSESWLHWLAPPWVRLDRTTFVPERVLHWWPTHNDPLVFRPAVRTPPEGVDWRSRV